MGQFLTSHHHDFQSYGFITDITKLLIISCEKNWILSILMFQMSKYDLSNLLKLNFKKIILFPIIIWFKELTKMMKYNHKTKSASNKGRVTFFFVPFWNQKILHIHTCTLQFWITHNSSVIVILYYFVHKKNVFASLKIFHKTSKRSPISKNRM